MEAPLITTLRNERANKRENGGQIISNNEYSAEFRTNNFLHPKATNWLVAFFTNLKKRFWTVCTDNATRVADEKTY